ncbi:putative selenate ABC transporter substrate-binding protein [soil metagenome]
MKPITATVLAASVLALASCAQDEKPGGGRQGDASQPTLRFSAIPDHNTTELEEKYGGLAAHLTEALGVPVEFVASDNYTASVEMFKNGDIQLAWFGGLTGVQAREAVPGSRAIVQGKADPEYYSYFIAHADTGLERGEAFPTAIADLTFTFGSESSTSGRLMPEFFILQNTGKSPQEFFTKPIGFSGAHDKTAELVSSGQWQAGVLSYTTYDALVEEGKIDPDVCKIIWKSPPYSDYNFTAHPDIDGMFGEDFTQKLADTLIAIDDPQLLSVFPREALIPASNDEYDAIKEVATQLGFLR